MDKETGTEARARAETDLALLGARIRHLVFIIFVVLIVYGGDSGTEVLAGLVVRVGSFLLPGRSLLRRRLGLSCCAALLGFTSSSSSSIASSSFCKSAKNTPDPFH